MPFNYFNAMKASMKTGLIGKAGGVVGKVFTGGYGASAQGAAIGGLVGAGYGAASDRRSVLGGMMGGMAIGGGAGFAGGAGMAARNYMKRGMGMGKAIRWGAKAESIKLRAEARMAGRLIGNTSRKGYNTFRSMWR